MRINKKKLNKLIGEKIASYRRFHKVTQAELAQKLDISIVSLGFKERGIRRFYVDEIVLISNILDIDISKLSPSVDELKKEGLL